MAASLGLAWQAPDRGGPAPSAVSSSRPTQGFGSPLGAAPCNTFHDCSILQRRKILYMQAISMPYQPITAGQTPSTCWRSSAASSPCVPTCALVVMAARSARPCGGRLAESGSVGASGRAASNIGLSML
eukprot:6235210-Prymnesium_polylepis.3